LGLTNSKIPENILIIQSKESGEKYLAWEMFRAFVSSFLSLLSAPLVGGYDGKDV
jgi:hypothetical protein